MEYHIEELISQETVEKKIGELAEQLNRDYEGKELHLIVVLKGSVFFATELAKRLTMPVTMDFMAVSSYGSGMVSAGEITVTKELDEDIEGKDVLIVEDIFDSGITLFNLRILLLARNPKSLKIITLLDKKDNHNTEVPIDYVGFEIPNKFVVGYGLDYAQKHRNLPYIGVIVEN
ncbi:MAG: hypoxanthine phosphoribosyltransferase [Lachnospiraceae bacterium]|jgi:hypoxanthine phosphoribosyltransferase|nr:hypoxanthine phosphoribosyltransferase [Lachnospiraceae bacterium]